MSHALHGHGPGTPVHELPLLPAVLLPADATFADAARAMVRARTPAVLLGDGESIVTEHDVVHALARGRSADDPARVGASPDPVGIRGSATALEAVDVMLRRGIRTLVVVDDLDRPRGLLTLLTAADVLLAAVEVPQWLGALRVALRVEMTRQ